MGYKSRKRNLKNRREKLQVHHRNIRIILTFALIALGLGIFFNRYELWAWVRTYFY